MKNNMSEKTETNMEVVQETQNEKVNLPKRSELLAEHKKLSEKSDSLVKEMQQREYTINFDSKKIFDRLLKFLEKDAPWQHTTATGLIMLYHNLREQKEITKDKEWDGLINLRSANVAILWQMMTRMSGQGFFEARNFVELMASIGEEVSKAVNQVQEDNQGLRDIHQELAKLDQILDSGQCENDTDEEDTRYKIADEVDPQV